ncbi:MAG: acyl-ACP--UDP-N-acetylglucosamine O-acyltransferase [Thermodesulfovibrionales bacterium]
MATVVHPTAIVEEGAFLDEDVSVGPYCVVGKDVKLGRSASLVSHVAVQGDTEIGEGCTVHPFATIGLPPQDIKYKGEPTRVRIGSGNVIREYVSIHRASVGGDGETVIGDRNFLMAYVHVAHDCRLGSGIIIANTVGLSGHVQVEDNAVIGGMVGVHQFTRIGAYAMVGGYSRIAQDIPPYMMASGAERSRLFGVNTVGLKRHGFSEETVAELKSAYRILFREKLSLQDAIKKVQAELPYTDEIRHLIEFIQKNKRGICR